MPHQHRTVLRRVTVAILALVFTIAAFPVFAQPPFDKSEFTARREKLFKQIPGGIAIIFAEKEQIYPLKFRQLPDFYNLTGIEEPDMDYGSDYDYYTSDITRTWPVSGRFTPEQEKMYRCILDARNTVIAVMKPGAGLKTLKDLAEEVYKKHGFQKEFLALGRYIGHYVGISVHDVGPYFDQSQAFVPGVVFNVEPILEFRDQKIHFRLEDTVLITENGAENLTAGVPAEVDEIYALIKQEGLSLKK